jgi:single-strand DNA-binding protein
MSDINTVAVSGRIGTDPKLKYFESGAIKCDISIGVNRWSTKDKKELTTWLNCQIWGKKAEFVGEYGKAGDMVFISGSLQKDVYEKDGKKCANSYILVEEIRIQNYKTESTKQE